VDKKAFPEGKLKGGREYLRKLTRLGQRKGNKHGGWFLKRKGGRAHGTWIAKGTTNVIGHCWGGEIKWKKMRTGKKPKRPIASLEKKPVNQGTFFFGHC